MNNFDKIDRVFVSTYYGVVLGNRLINAKPTDVEKKVFEDEYKKHLIYFFENFSENKDELMEKFFEFLNKVNFDIIVKELNDKKRFFEPYDYNVERLINYTNDIDQILSRINNKKLKYRYKLKTDL